MTDSRTASQRDRGNITTDLPAEFVRRIGEMLGQRYVVRSHVEISRFFEGPEVLTPGLVQVDQWPVDGPIPAPARLIPIDVGLARKPWTGREVE